MQFARWADDGRLPPKIVGDSEGRITLVILASAGPKLETSTERFGSITILIVEGRKDSPG